MIKTHTIYSDCNVSCLISKLRSLCYELRKLMFNTYKEFGCMYCNSVTQFDRLDD